MQDRRTTTVEALTPELVETGKAQLEKEIRILEDWLQELDETSKDNTAAMQARLLYLDMLQSRRDVLHRLLKDK